MGGIRGWTGVGYVVGIGGGGGGGVGIGVVDRHAGGARWVACGDMSAQLSSASVDHLALWNVTLAKCCLLKKRQEP